MPTRLPAEWEPQAGVLLTWPHADTDWYDRLHRVEPVFAQIGATIAQHEMLLLVCQSVTHATHVSTILSQHGAHPARLVFTIAESNDTWARDFGPICTLQDGNARLNGFRFNGWGNKFVADLDDAITDQLISQGVFSDIEYDAVDIVLEGGAIETDGQGTMLATRSSTITESRNPGLTQTNLEENLESVLGIERFLWLDHGNVSGDDTDGHIDTLARFADPETILYATAPADDADHISLAAMASQLRSFRTAEQKPYRLLPLPFPGLHLDDDGRRLPASYANFLIINDAVLAPVYGVAQDNQAITTLQLAFPRREVIAIDCREIIRQNGSLHCLTMQLPAEVMLRNTLEPTVT